MTTDEARSVFKSSGLTYKDLSRDNLKRLRTAINDQMTDDDSIMKELKCRYRFRVSIADGHINQAYLGCKSYKFDDREAVSFNSDGFIGFAGWADSTNIQPILLGFVDWVQGMVNLHLGIRGK